MADEVLHEALPERHAHHPARTVAKWAGIALGVLLLLIAGIFFGINTDVGRRFVVDKINDLEMASGLDVDIGRIEGSIYGKLTIHELTLKDTKGIFFTAPVAELDWSPFSYLNKHLDIESLNIPQARLRRLPVLRPGDDSNAPMLPDLDIDIGRLSIGRLGMDAAVTGQRHLLSLDGRAKIADGRAQVALNAGALTGAGIAGGDRLVLRLDAVPDANRFDVNARVQAPANGFVAGMTGIKQPLVAAVNGRGSWANWQGRAQAMLGGKPFANLAVTGRDGTFSVDGPLNPGLIVTGPFQRMVEPFLQVNLVATLAERRADMRLRLSSSAMAMSAQGLLDLGKSQFGNMRVAARLLKPGAIAPNLSGRDVRLNLVLNGAFATPRVAYDLQAARLGFNDTILEGFRATGAARVDSDRIVVPLSARVRRIIGLNEAAVGLLTNVAIDGTLAISGTRLLSDNLRVRSDKINATAILVADMSKGQYQVGLQGRINNYLVRGIGLLDIDSKMDVVSQGGGFGLRGRVAVRTRQLENASVRDFLGGNAVISANINMNPAGVIAFDNVRMAAPLVRITSGSGTYSPDGRININLAGVSKAYGRVAVAITGTATAPQIRLRAANPGFGIGLSNVNATVRSVAGGYAITATGQSQYGPFSADVLVRTGRGPLTIDIRRVTFAGINFRGRVVQTPAGPFVGTLSMNGQGLDGTIRLGAVGRIQQAQISATANGARIPGDPPILIQRGIIEATATLYPDAPSIVGDVQLAGARRGELQIDTARARIDYRGGRGRAQIVARGRSGVPFDVASNVALTPTHIRAAAQGNVNRIAFRLAEPADLRKVAGAWQLSPTTIVLPQGNVRLAGRFGNDMIIRSRIDGLDLAILNVFSPGLGIGGRATGSVDFTQPAGGAFPRGEARINIANFTRTGLTTASVPVNIATAATMGPEGGALAAVIRRASNVIGRAQVRLQPLSPAAGSWTNRLLGSPLSGGVRYNGPAQVLWSLAGIADQQLSGPIGVAADFSGRVASPTFNGVIRANDLTFVDENYGTRITQIGLQGRFTSSRLEITQLTGRAGEGTIQGSGSVGLAANAGYPIDIRVALDNARLARGDAIGATATGEVQITNSRAGGAIIKGDLQLPEVRYQIVRQGAAEVVELQGVRRKGEPLLRPDQLAAQEEGAPSVWKLDLRVRAPNKVFVSGMGLESEWGSDLRVQGTTATPRVVGSAEVIRGTFSFAGNRFEVRTGEVTFTGARPINPRINLAATGEVGDVEITLGVTGTGTDPQIRFTSNPGLPQDEIMARLLFGGSVTELSALQLVQLGTSLNSLRGGGGGLNPLGKLRSATGAARLRILGADEATGRGTALAAGFYLGNNVYLELITDARGFTATQLEVALSKTLSILSQAGTGGGTNVNARYRKKY
jgi:translocation and assembly module TamB